ncbi:hypothetical protein ACQW02_06440 [Humitalea sp. 24SJ18S-53]|uniref:hypothetical protein n=1 Tax=Humitalea sp. 24SJ18S-53 TaxID=3422307 RepID=UPI003D679E6D
MHRRTALLLPLTLPLLAACQTSASFSETVTMVAIVETVDRTAREVLLRGQAGAQTGALVTVRAGAGVRNFDQIRSGDRVTVQYFQAVAAQIVRAGSPGGAPSAEIAAMRAAPGERPAGAVGDLVRVRVTITSVDTTTNTVGFVGPNGQPRLVYVRRAPMQELLRSLRVGDQVDIAFEEALAVSVEPAR